MPRYRYLSDALNEVVRERGQPEPMPLRQESTPIFMRVLHRRGLYGHDFTGWSKPVLCSYIKNYHPSPPDLRRLNRRALVRLAERVREWEGFDSEYPSDQDLVIPLQIWKLEHRFTGARLTQDLLVSVNGDAEQQEQRL